MTSFKNPKRYLSVSNSETLLLLITKYCKQSYASKKLLKNTTINMKHYYSYNYIKQYTDRPCGGSSIITNNNIPHSEITLNTNMQASLYQQLPKSNGTQGIGAEQFNRATKTLHYNGDFNSCKIKGTKKTDKKGKVIESLSNQHLCIYFNKPNKYLHPATVTYSAIDLTICDSYPFLDYNWKVHDTRGSDHFLILLENTTNELSKSTSSSNLGKANWNGFKTSCLPHLTPEANKTRKASYILPTLYQT